MYELLGTERRNKVFISNWVYFEKKDYINYSTGILSINDLIAFYKHVSVVSITSMYE